MPLRRGIVVFGALALVAGLTTPAAAHPRPGRTERVSVASNGTEGNDHSTFPTVSPPSISGDGRYVAFSSLASNLVAGDTNGAEDVFVHDRQTKTIERVSLASDGTEANGSSLTPAVSADGRYVAFQSIASNLVPGDTNGVGDAFVHDRQTGVTERVSVATDGTEQNAQNAMTTYAPSKAPAISADGRYVAFASAASNLVPGDANGVEDVFVRDRQTKTTEMVSVATDGSQGQATTSVQNPGSYMPAISGDGRYVAFVSYATNLDGDDLNFWSDVFVHDRQTGVTERVSVPTDGSEPNLWAGSPTLSADGRYVAFDSNASNLVPADANWSPDVFVHDRQTKRTERISVAADGAEATNPGPFALPLLGLAISQNPVISADGRHVAFMSGAANLVPGDTNGRPDIFVHDRLTRKTERVSLSNEGGQVESSSLNPAISADGRYVVFRSFAPDLVPGDTNDAYDMFVRDRGPAVGVGGIEATATGERVEVSGWATFSAVVASADDPDDDAGPGAREVGAELTGASLVLRPEEEDLLVRISLADLPSVRPPSGTHSVVYLGYGLPGVAGLPGVLYGFELEVDGVGYEVRAQRQPGAEDPGGPDFALYRCEATCVRVAGLSGGYGTTGEEIVVSLPLASLGAEWGAGLTGVRAFAALGEANVGGIGVVDEVSLPDAELTPPEVRLGVASPETPGQAVVFDTPATLAEGTFAATVDLPSPEGDYEIWARACLGATCGFASVRVTWH